MHQQSDDMENLSSNPKEVQQEQQPLYLQTNIVLSNGSLGVTSPDTGNWSGGKERDFSADDKATTHHDVELIEVAVPSLTPTSHNSKKVVTINTDKPQVHGYAKKATSSTPLEKKQAMKGNDVF